MAYHHLAVKLDAGFLRECVIDGEIELFRKGTAVKTGDSVILHTMGGEVFTGAAADVVDDVIKVALDKVEE